LLHIICFHSVSAPKIRNAIVRYAEFTPRPVNQAGAQGEAVREIANGAARQRRRRGKMHKRRAYRVAGLLWNYGIMRLWG